MEEHAGVPEYLSPCPAHLWLSTSSGGMFEEQNKLLRWKLTSLEVVKWWISARYMIQFVCYFGAEPLPSYQLLYVSDFSDRTSLGR